MTATKSSTSDVFPLKTGPIVRLVGDFPAAHTLPPVFRTTRNPREPADLVVVAAAAVNAALLEELEAAGAIPAIVLADPASADPAGALMGLAVSSFLPADCEADVLVKAIEAALHSRRGMHVSDTTRPFDPRLDELRRQAAQVAAAVEALASAAPGPETRPVDAPRIRAHIKARRVRESFFDAGLFADPAWDILLDLAAARLEGRPVSVSSLCIAASVPTTTALRWIKNMVDAGLLERRADREDARRAFIALAPATATTLERCMEACFNHPGL